MADVRPIKVGSGAVPFEQVANADVIIVGLGVKTPVGSTNNLTLTPDGGTVVVVGLTDTDDLTLPIEGRIYWPFFDTALTWEIVTGHAVFDGTTDDIMNIGSNVGPAGARIDPTKHSVGIQIEHRYDAGAIEWAEVFFRYVSAGGVERRPVACQVNIATNVDYVSISAEDVYFMASDMTTQRAKCMASGWLYYTATLQWVDTVVNPQLTQAVCNVGGASGQCITIRAQPNVNATGAGGNVVIEGGGSLGGAGPTADGWVRIGQQTAGYGIDVRPTEVAMLRFTNMGALLRFWSRTTAQLTGLGGAAGDSAYCTDAAGGATPVYHDGSAWRRETDDGFWLQSYLAKKVFL